MQQPGRCGLWLSTPWAAVIKRRGQLDTPVRAVNGLVGELGGEK